MSASPTLAMANKIQVLRSDEFLLTSGDVAPTDQVAAN